MQARGLLMVEHRLIERMIAVVSKRLETGDLDPLFVDTAVDFIRTYADRTHHGKEEDILFRDLETRALSAQDRRAMDELVHDHMVARQTTSAVVETNGRYRQGDGNALPELTEKLRFLVEFYPRHIRQEDKVFFPAARSYFTDEEDQAMLAEFWEFDRAMIHVKYRDVVEGLEQL
jgi:hemerythrin-like domain-containing protein